MGGRPQAARCAGGSAWQARAAICGHVGAKPSPSSCTTSGEVSLTWLSGSLQRRRQTATSVSPTPPIPYSPAAAPREGPASQPLGKVPHRSPSGRSRIAAPRERPASQPLGKPLGPAAATRMHVHVCAPALRHGLLVGPEALALRHRRHQLYRPGGDSTQTRTQGERSTMLDRVSNAD